MAVTSYSLIYDTVYRDLDVNNLGQLVTNAADTTLFSIRIDNTLNSTPTYVKLYNQNTLASAADDPDYILKVAGSSVLEFHPNMGLGRQFSTGISIRGVTQPGTGGTTDPTSVVTATLLTS